jgi:hypothetical protein
MIVITGYGYVGKAIEALLKSSLQHGCSLSLIQEAIRYNKKIRK